MKIIDGLLGEHALFHSTFDGLEHVLSEATSAIEIQRAVETLAPGILSHAALEDELLLPAIAAHIPNGPTQVMRAEHREIDALTAQIARAGSLEEARDCGARLLDLLRDHFHKEEAMLFPMAEHHLDDKKLQELGQRWKARRGLA
jgi:hemerythrin-like domain-containing protein